MSRSAAETCVAVVEVNSSYDQTNRDFFTAFHDLHGDGEFNAANLTEFARNHYANTLKTSEFCAALEEHREAVVLDFFQHLSCLYAQQSAMREKLESSESSSGEKLDRISSWKKVSAVFFTAITMICAAVAAANASFKRPAVAAVAAAASILFGALGNLVHTRLKKHEGKVKKYREIITVMNMWARFAVGDLIAIYVSARRSEFHSKSMSSELMVDGVRKKQMKMSFEELQREDSHYSRDMSSAKEYVLQSMIKHSE